MARVIKNKELTNARLATNYGGWIYCTKCNENIGYLCYSTYDEITLDYQCKCGSIGKIKINFEDSLAGQKCNSDLIIIKNRFCCPHDNQPLLTMLDQKIASYDIKITCKDCHNTYYKTK